MLVLTRKLGESVRIGDDVVVTVVGVRGNQIRLGIDAPQEVKIRREEISDDFHNQLRKREYSHSKDVHRD